MSRSKIFGYISTVALAATVLVATPATAAVSCITINKYYEHGVSASKYSRNIGNDLVGSPRVKSSIYKKYAHLDLDKDKIVCEIESDTDKYEVAKAAYASVMALRDGSATASGSSVILSDSLPKVYKSWMLDELSGAISMWDERYGVIAPYTIVGFSNKEGAWADQQARLLNVSPGPRGSWIPWIEEWEGKGMDHHCGIGAANPNGYFQCLSYDHEKSRFMIDDGALHEYFHSIQLNSIGIDTRNIPVWLMEGSAAYFGITGKGNGYRDLLDHYAEEGSYEFYMEHGHGRFGDWFGAGLMTEENILKMYQRLEGAHTENGDNVYAVGAWATEYLIGTYGYEAFMDWLDSVGKGAYWKTSFRSSFGMTPDEFYLEMLRYLTKVYS